MRARFLPRQHTRGRGNRGKGYIRGWEKWGALLTCKRFAETRASYGSQDLSEADLNVALEYTDDIIRATRATYVPRSLYAKLLRLMYQGVAQGLPVAEIHELGQQLVRAVISGTGEQGNGSQSGMDGPGQGSR